ncbi:MAG: T9SS type A sorting domain-containing protein [Bacteroidota bacterium]
MKKFLLLHFIFLFASLLINDAFAQGPLRRVWDYRYGGNDADGTTCFIQTRDNGFAIAGYSTSGATGDKTQPSWGSYDYWIVKLDTGGIMQTNFRFGGFSDDLLTAIQQTSDGGYITGGFSSSDIGGDRTENSRGSYDYWIVKADSAGNKMWDKRFGGDDYDELFSVLQVADGGYLLGGWSLSGANGDKSDTSFGGSDYWIVRTDSMGNKMWDKRYGGLLSESLYAMLAMADGGFLLCGTSSSDISGDKSENSRGSNDYWIVRIDSLGNKIWDKTFGGSGIDVPSCIQPVTGGDFIVGGWSDSPFDGDKSDGTNGLQDFWILKFDSLGNKIWDRDFGGVDIEDGFGNVFQTLDSGFMVSGTSYSGISGDKTETNLGAEQNWLIKTDSLGIQQWDKTILTTGHDETGFTIQSSDGCYAVTVPSSGGIGGFKTQDTRGFNDYWTVKFCDSTLWPNTIFSSSNIQICPGTCTDFINFSQNAVTYQWSFPGGIPSSSNDSMPSTICYANPGSYDVMLVSTNYFATDTLFVPNYITVYPQTLPQSIHQINDTLYSNLGFQTYQWYLDGNLIPGATEYFYFALAPGNYNVVCSDSNGCELEAAIFDVLISVDQINGRAGFEIFPNPVENKFTIYYPLPAAIGNTREKTLVIFIYNLLGDMVKSVPAISLADGHSGEIDISWLSPGVYWMEVNNTGLAPGGTDKKFRTKLVKL